MRVNNPNRSPLRIHNGDPAQTPTAFLEIAGDYFPVLHAGGFCSLRRMFITRAIEFGVDVKVIASWQGHRDGGKLILDTYSHLNPVHSHRMSLLMTTEKPANVVEMQTATVN
jgi:hypothetical protein